MSEPNEKDLARRGLFLLPKIGFEPWIKIDFSYTEGIIDTEQLGDKSLNLVSETALNNQMK